MNDTMAAFAQAAGPGEYTNYFTLFYTGGGNKSQILASTVDFRHTSAVAFSCVCVACRPGYKLQQIENQTIYTSTQLKTRNSPGDEIANVNFLCDDVVHALKIQ